MLAVLDRRYIYRMVNQAFLNFRRQTRERVLGHSAEDILGTEHFTHTVKPYLDRCLQGESIRFEMARHDLESRQHSLEVCYYPLRDQSGDITKVVARISDITDRKQGERELQETRDALEVANRHLEERVQEELHKRRAQEELLIQRSKLESLGKLAAGIAHEINQPLAGISMGLDNMLLKLSSGKLSETYFSRKIDVLLGHIDRIKHIIDHIRTFSREQSSASIERVDVNEVCRNAVSMLRTQYNYHHIALELLLDQTATAYVLGNSYKLEQVILNLLANARDALDDREKQLGSFSYRKQIAIRTACRDGRIEIEVRDNGAGIPEELLQKIFDPFFTTKDPERGTGLGLSVSYGIIKDMQGDISVESRVGEYTLMRLSFPKIQG